MMMKKKMNLKKINSLIFNCFIPFLTIIFFLLFNYANNVNVVSITDLIKLILPGILIALVVYFLLGFVYRNDYFKSSIASFIFLIFFLHYGVVFDWLRKIDLVQIENFSFLPFFILLAIYTSLSIKKVNRKVLNNLHTIILITLVSLIALNLVKIIPVEIKKASLMNASTEKSAIKIADNSESNKYPDIYFIILDEASGFEAAREYFYYNKVDDFVSFLKANQFYVAEDSNVSYYSTLYSMSSRLNYQEFPTKADDMTYFEAITQNKVMQYLKQKGYTTIVFSELNRPYAYSAMPPIKSDFDFYPDENETGLANFTSFGELGQLLINETMLRPFNNQVAIHDPIYTSHQKMIYFTIDKISKLEEIQSPKFVYVHLLLPHAPFMFDKLGNLNALEKFNNNNNYLGNYIYSLDVAKMMISEILKNYDSQFSPVIILQSDHGFKNGTISNSPENYLLDNYPEEYKTLIINAIRIPECNDAPFSQDMNPINTFPIIFSCVFEDNIPLN